MKASKTAHPSLSMNKILEIGCGEGFNTFILSRNNYAIGIDISEENLKIAAKRYPEIMFIRMASEALAFNADEFDEIHAMDVLEHVDNLEEVLSEIQRVLKQSGQVIANIPYWKSEAWLSKVRPTYRQEIHHVRIFQEDELEDKLKLCKFKVINKYKAGFLSHIEFFFMLKRNIKSDTQLGIGNWRDNYATAVLHITLLFFNPAVLRTPLRFFPIWLVTLPIGLVIDFFGNKYFPKSVSYKFVLQ